MRQQSKGETRPIHMYGCYVYIRWQIALHSATHAR